MKFLLDENIGSDIESFLIQENHDVKKVRPEEFDRKLYVLEENGFRVR